MLGVKYTKIEVLGAGLRRSWFSWGSAVNQYIQYDVTIAIIQNLKGAIISQSRKGCIFLVCACTYIHVGGSLLEDTMFKLN